MQDREVNRKTHQLRGPIRPMRKRAPLIGPQALIQQHLRAIIDADVEHVLVVA